MASRRTRARAWDMLVLLLVFAVLYEVLTTDQDVPLALSVPVALAMTVPLLWGQRRPLPVAAVVLIAWDVQALAGSWAQEPQSELLPACMVFWCLGAYVPGRTADWAAAAAFAALVVHEPGDVIVLGPLMLGVYAAGRLMRSREELAHALEVERGRSERYAVAEERARIARELHDVVGHSITLMTVQAGAERLALGRTRPETSQVLEQIETTGRQAMQEMRRMLGLLRTPDDPELTPQPGLGQLGVLVDRMSAAGLAVDLHLEGAANSVAAGVDISAYRVVQEALTNVLKHSQARRADVRVRQTADGLVVEVVDAGQSSRAPGAPGHGVAGLRERVSLYGGELDAGPLPDGGWRTRAFFPREPAS